jgi:transcriptional/translational regulatory protein YebC/TACO1
MFPQKGFISFDNGGKGEEELMEPVLEAGAEDMEFGKGDAGREVQVICDPRKLIAIKKAVEEKGLKVLNAELILVASSTVTELSQEDNESLQKLIDILEDNEDIQSVNHNYSPPDQETPQ